MFEVRKQVDPPDHRAGPTTAGPTAVVVEISGEIDLASAPELRDGLISLVAAGRAEIVVDGSGVEFIDASGINVLLDAADAARRAGGHLRLSRPSPSFRRLLDLLELNNALPVDREADWEPESTGPC